VFGLGLFCAFNVPFRRDRQAVVDTPIVSSWIEFCLGELLKAPSEDFPIQSIRNWSTQLAPMCPNASILSIRTTLHSSDKLQLQALCCVISLRPPRSKSKITWIKHKCNPPLDSVIGDFCRLMVTKAWIELIQASLITVFSGE